MTLSFFAIQTSLQSEIFARTSWAPVEYKTAGETVSLWLFWHVKFFKADVTSKFEYTRVSVAVAEVSHDIVPRRLQ